MSSGQHAASVKSLTELGELFTRSGDQIGAAKAETQVTEHFVDELPLGSAADPPAEPMVAAEVPRQLAQVDAPQIQADGEHGQVPAAETVPDSGRDMQIQLSKTDLGLLSNCTDAVPEADVSSPRETQFTQLQEDHARFKATVAELQSALANAEEERRQMEVTLKKLGKSLERETERADEALRSLERDRTKATGLRRQIRDMGQAAEEAAARIRKAERLARRMENQAETFRQEIDALRARPELVFTNQVLLDWLVEDAGPANIGIGRGDLLGWTGTGPYHPGDFDPLLLRLGLAQHDLPHESISHVIVGRDDWSREHLELQIELRRGRTLRVYSQEMLVAALITGRDPLNATQEILDYFKTGNQALQFLAGDALQWPTIAVPRSFRPPEPPTFGLDESPLRLLGYIAGKTSGRSPRERRSILLAAFEAERLPRPKDATDEYMSAWGYARMPQRLWRIAYHLASLANLHRHQPMAREDWTSDLGWLHESIYMPRGYRFAWPDVAVGR